MGDDLAPTPRQAAQLSVSKPQCGVFCPLHRLVIDSGEEGRRQTPPVESCAVEEIGGTTSQGKIPRTAHTLAVPRGAQNLIL